MIITPDKWKIIGAMAAECDEANRKWIEQNKHLPCEKCGASDDVEFIPTGSIGRLTPLCPVCNANLKLETAAFWYGFDEGQKHFMRKPWWKRLFL